MAVREIRFFGDPVLTKACSAIKEITPEVLSHAQDLLDTVSFDGRAGLASNQIGHTLRAFSLNIDGQVSVILNPEIIALEGEPQPTGEGCLSIPDLWFDVMRFPKAIVRGIDLTGKEKIIKGEGLLAQALQHECDHLDGKLYIHRLEGEDRKQALKLIRSSTWF